MALAETTKLERAPRNETLGGRILRLAWKSIDFKIGFTVAATLILLSIFGPYIIDVSPTAMDVKAKFLPPFPMDGWQIGHLAGTDQLGRDLLMRSLVGLRNALVIGVASVVGMFVLGSAIGMIAGYYGKWTDLILMRLTDVQMSIPVVILAIAILGVTRPNEILVISVLILAGWPAYARVTRSVVLAERQKEYVRGAKIIGASNFRIMLRYIAPSILPTMAFVAVLDVARMMIFEAIFGFIGIGIQPPTPTFGNIIAAGTQYLLNAWWITVVPGLILTVTLASINLMGSALERARNKVIRGVE
ncbi:MAG: ABC transporter permease [Rhizobiaceae bacterium]|nr:ABC transporter permease [Rhizobiaceae bacterium]